MPVTGRLFMKVKTTVCSIRIQSNCQAL